MALTTELVWGIIALISTIVLLTVILILTRYKKCKSDEVLVIYGKTGSNKSSAAAKCYHGGAAFVWPVFQGYEIMSMRPMQIECNLRDTFSAEKVKVSVPVIITVAISTDPTVMQNAAIRLLGMKQEDITQTIKDIVWGQMRDIVSKFTPEDLVSRRDEFLKRCIENLEPELNKIGMSMININIAEVSDSADYLENKGKQAAERAKNEAMRQIEEQQKLGELGVAEQRKEKEIQLSEIQRDQQIQVSENNKTQAVRTAEIDKERATVTKDTEKERDIKLSEIERDKKVSVAKNEADGTQQVAKLERDRDITVAQQESERDSESAKARQTAAAEIAEATKQSEARQAAAAFTFEAAKSKAEQEKVANIATYESDTRKTKANAERDAKVSENQASIQVAKSDAQFGQERASADKIIGESKAQAEEAVGKANAKRKEEVAKAEAAAKREELNSTIIVEAEAEAERKKKEAEGIKAKAVTEAEGEAEAIRIKAVAEAERIRLTKLAEAEGAKALAEARKVEIGAETANIAALKEAGMTDMAIVQWAMKDEYKHIVEAEQKKFEHINLGDVKVIGGNGEVGNFLLKTVDAIAKSTETMDLVPGLPGVLNRLKQWDASSAQPAQVAAPAQVRQDQPEFEDPDKPNGGGTGKKPQHHKKEAGNGDNH